MVSARVGLGKKVLLLSFFGNVAVLMAANYYVSEKTMSIGILVVNALTLVLLYRLGAKGLSEEKSTFGMFLQAGGVLAAACGVAGAFLNVGTMNLATINSKQLIASLFPFIEGMVATGLSTVLTSFLAADTPDGASGGLGEGTGGGSGSGGTSFTGTAMGIDPALAEEMNLQAQALVETLQLVTSAAEDAHISIKNMSESSASTQKSIANIGKLFEDFGHLLFAKSEGTP